MSGANAARGRRNRSAGNEAERSAARWLTTEGWPTITARNAERGKGRQSRTGDLIITDAPHITSEVKCVQKPAVATWLAQLDNETDLPCKALLWKHPEAALSRPGEWLAIVANHPLDWWAGDMATPMPLLRPLDAPTLRSVLGWLDVEHVAAADGWHPSAHPLPSLSWTGPDWSEWLLMRASTFVDEVLPCWEGLS